MKCESIFVLSYTKQKKEEKGYEKAPMLDANGKCRFGMMGMMNVSFTKEELLKMNKKLNRIRKPKNKK